METREYESLRKSLDSLRERLEFNAPFGRSDQPVVLDIERQIYLRADKLYRHMQLLTSKSEQTKDASELVGEALAMLELVKSREKLNIRDRGLPRKQKTAEYICGIRQGHGTGLQQFLL